MREVTFKAIVKKEKSFSEGLFVYKEGSVVYGAYFQSIHMHYIVFLCNGEFVGVEVDKNTVSQITAIEDIDENPIFERSILLCGYDNEKRIVEWNNEEAGFICRHLNDEPYIEPLNLNDDYFKVISWLNQ